MISNNISKIYNNLTNGIYDISDNDKKYMNDIVDYCLSNDTIGDYLDDIITIIKISNIIYNNMHDVVFPLDDDKYDRIIVFCKRHNIQYPVGAIPVNNIKYISDKDKLDIEDHKPKQVVSIVPNKNDMIYFNTLSTNVIPIDREDYIVNHDNTLVNKKTRNVSHNYDMCGTLDKCKYTLNNEAREAGVFDDPNVSIFERDFIGKHIQKGLVDPNNIELLVSIKYDGISVEAEIQNDTIISACTRGDMSNNEASDLTPILKGFKFHRASCITDNNIVGVKFEFIVTHTNLYRLSQEFGKTYVNPRNAVIGLMGGLDARMYRDYITPVPLESSLNIDRITELEVLNRLYTKGIDMKYTVIKGNYVSVMYQLKKFVEEADELRGFMPFQYDGIVVEYLDPNLRKSLGKKGSIPNYSIAIKFNPLKRVSTFTHYTYSVGQNGMVVPMAHFKPVEFYGAIHDKTTLHSLKRFNEIQLRSGDKVNLTLNNDVIVYLTKSKDQEFNPNKPEVFPTTCPSCGSVLQISESGDTAYCMNFKCPERCISRLSNMLKKLNIKDFSSETIRALGATSFHDLLNYDTNYLIDKLGTVNGQKFKIRMNEICNSNYPDYRIIGSLGFSSIAIETWKLILSNISIDSIVNGSDEEIDSLLKVKGIGPKTVNIIKQERQLFYIDLLDILKYVKFERTPIGVSTNKPIVIFTGVRDKNLVQLFESKGFECKESGVTKSTSILIIPHIGYESGNVKKAFKILKDNYIKLNNESIEVSYNTLNKVNGLGIYIVPIDEAYEYIRNI